MARAHVAAVPRTHLAALDAVVELTDAPAVVWANVGLIGGAPAVDEDVGPFDDRAAHERVTALVGMAVAHECKLPATRAGKTRTYL